MPTIETFSGPLQKARSVNQTSNGYVSKIPTITEPAVADPADATSGVAFNVGLGGSVTRSYAFVLPYAIGSNNNTFSLRVIGWRLIDSRTDQGARLWMPTPLVEVQCTISSSCPGIAGKAVLDTELFADTITVTGTTANPNVGVEVVSPANDTLAHLLVDLKGAQKVEFSFTTGGSATSCNALFALL